MNSEPFGENYTFSNDSVNISAYQEVETPKIQYYDISFNKKLNETISQAQKDLYNEKFIAINSSGYIVESIGNDIQNWNQVTQVSNLGNNNWTSLTYGNSKTIALSATGYISVNEKPFTYVFTSEAEWQTSYTTYGECGKYVYNSSANTVRIPLYNSYFTNTVNSQKLGDLTEASLPNIRGTFNHETTGGTATGAFSIGSSIAGENTAPGGDTDHLIEFNAGAYNSIYKDSATTVNTQSIKQLVYIVVGK